MNETQWRRLRVDDARIGLIGRQARWVGYTQVVEGVVENIRFDTHKIFTHGEAPRVVLGPVEVQLLDRWYLITDVWVRGGETVDPTEKLRDKVHAQGQKIRDLREQVEALMVDTWDDLRDVPASVESVKDSYGVRVVREGRRWVRHNFHSKVVKRSESREYGPYTARWGGALMPRHPELQGVTSRLVGDTGARPSMRAGDTSECGYDDDE